MCDLFFFVRRSRRCNWMWRFKSARVFRTRLPMVKRGTDDCFVFLGMNVVILFLDFANRIKSLEQFSRRCPVRVSAALFCVEIYSFFCLSISFLVFPLPVFLKILACHTKSLLFFIRSHYHSSPRARFVADTLRQAQGERNFLLTPQFIPHQQPIPRFEPVLVLMRSCVWVSSIPCLCWCSAVEVLVRTDVVVPIAEYIKVAVELLPYPFPLPQSLSLNPSPAEGRGK